MAGLNTNRLKARVESISVFLGFFSFKYLVSSALHLLLQSTWFIKNKTKTIEDEKIKLIIVK